MFDGLTAIESKKAWEYLQQIQDLMQRKDAFDATMWQRLQARSNKGAQKARDFLRATDLPPTWEQEWASF